MSRCPQCGNEDTWFGATQTLHWMRVLVGSPKRFCPNCKSKWRVRAASVPGLGSFSHFVYFFIAILIGGWLFIMISDSLERAPEKLPAQSSSSSMSPVAMQQMALKAKQNPGAMGSMAEMKEKIKQNPGALAALRKNPQLMAQAKEKYAEMKK